MNQELKYGLLAVAVIALLVLGATHKVKEGPNSVSFVTETGDSWGKYENVVTQFDIEGLKEYDRYFTKIGPQILRISEKNGIKKFTDNNEGETGVFLVFEQSTDPNAFIWQYLVEFSNDLTVLEDREISLLNKQTIITKAERSGNSLELNALIGSWEIEAVDRDVTDDIASTDVKIYNNFGREITEIEATIKIFISSDYSIIELTIYPQDDIYLGKGNCLNILGIEICNGQSQNFFRPTNNIFELKESGSRYRFRGINNRGKKFDFIYTSKGTLGDGKNSIAVKETDKINIGDLLIVTSKDDTNGITEILEFDKEGQLKNINSNQRYYFDPLAGGKVNVNGYSHEVQVNPDGSIYFALTGANVDGDKAIIVLLGGLKVKTFSAGGFKIVAEGDLYKNKRAVGESIQVNLQKTDIKSITGVKMYKDDSISEEMNRDVERGIMDLGVAITQIDDSLYIGTGETYTKTTSEPGISI